MIIPLLLICFPHSYEARRLITMFSESAVVMVVVGGILIYHETSRMFFTFAQCYAMCNLKASAQSH